MALRFQKRVSLLPGLRLNFGLNGISATVGARGASVNFGKRGVYGNLGLPGTGLSYRTRLDRPTRQPGSGAAPERSVPVAPSIQTPIGERHFRSASVDRLSSEELRSLAELVRELVARRSALEAAVSHWARDLAKANRRLSWARSILLRKALATRIPLLESAQICLDHEKSGLEELLEGSCIDADFALTDESAARYDAVGQAFAELRNSLKIWDISRSRNVDRVRTRSAASHSIDRKAVRFYDRQLDAITSEFPALYLSNANGDDLYLYPGFLVVRESDNRLALIDLREVTIECENTRFIEEEGVPGDSKVVGTAWAKSNKDGSRDRRFSDNREIPVALYGEMALRSPTGLNEVYYFSRASASQAFGAAFREYQRSLPRRTGVGQAEAVPVPTLPALEIPDRLPVPSLWPWWVRLLGWTGAAIGVVLLLVYRSLWLPALQDATQQWRADSYAHKSAAHVTSPTALTPNGPSAASRPIPGPTPAPASPPVETMSREDIRQAQTWLNELGYVAGVPDGSVGPMTANAIKLFQTSNGLPVTGRLDRRTWAVLLAQAQGTSHPPVQPNSANAPSPASLEMAALNNIVRTQLINCWFLPSDVATGPERQVTIRAYVNAQGYVTRAEIVEVERMGDPLYRKFAEGAYRATINPKCQPLRINPAVVNLSRPLDLAFTSR